MSEKFSLNNGNRTLRQKLEAARAGEVPQISARSRRKSPLTSPMIVLLLVLAGTAIALAVAFPWLVQQPREMFVPFFAGAAILIIVLSIAFSVLYDRSTDEWQRAATRFSSQWGFWAGLGLALLLIFPLSAWIETWAPGGYRDFVKVGFMFGVVAVLGAQVACVAMLHLGWTLWMSRPARGPHEEQD